MTVQQIEFFDAIYLLILIVVIFFTRPVLRRLTGALAGGLSMGVAAAGIIRLGTVVGWWHFVMPSEPNFLILMWIGFVLCGYVFLITWRIARRFGWRGLGIAMIVLVLLGSVRDRWYMRRFPEWGSHAPGIAPVLAISATYVVLGIVGHGVMRLLSGPAKADRLAPPFFKRGDTN